MTPPQLLVDIEELAPHEQRVVQELEDLLPKLTKLVEFMETTRFHTVSPREQDLLRAQSTFMLGYSEILLARCKIFEAATLKKRSEAITNLPDDYEV